MTNASRLSIATRDVGRVTIVQCNGRIVAGTESESLRAHVAWLLRDRRSIVLHLGEVAFIDSSGLGTIVRTLTSTRQVHGDLKLCKVPEHVRKVLDVSHLSKLFETHDSEENAVAAFYRPKGKTVVEPVSERSILCVDSNADVLAYLRELLRRAGHDVHTSSPSARCADSDADHEVRFVGGGDECECISRDQTGFSERLRRFAGH